MRSAHCKKLLGILVACCITLGVPSTSFGQRRAPPSNGSFAPGSFEKLNPGTFTVHPQPAQPSPGGSKPNWEGLLYNGINQWLNNPTRRPPGSRWRGGGSRWGSYQSGGYPSDLSYPSNNYPSNSYPSDPPATVPANPLPNPGITDGGPVVVVNPPDSGNTVTYVVGGNAQRVAPGYSQSLGTGSYIIEFDRGGKFGRARYTISDGTFTFAVTNRGWDLHRKTYKVTLDNTLSTNAFNCAINGQAVVVPAGLSQTHKSPRPIAIAFDHGSGGQPVRRTLDSGVYTVTVNPQTGLWDLLSAAQTAMPVASSQ